MAMRPRATEREAESASDAAGSVSCWAASAVGSGSASAISRTSDRIIRILQGRGSWLDGLSGRNVSPAGIAAPWADYSADRVAMRVVSTGAQRPDETPPGVVTVMV